MYLSVRRSYVGAIGLRPKLVVVNGDKTYGRTIELTERRMSDRRSERSNERTNMNLIYVDLEKYRPKGEIQRQILHNKVVT